MLGEEHTVQAPPALTLALILRSSVGLDAILRSRHCFCCNVVLKMSGVLPAGAHTKGKRACLIAPPALDMLLPSDLVRLEVSLRCRRVVSAAM